MDAEAQRRKRMEEIEEKKKRLEQMRKSRATADGAATAATSSAAPESLLAPPTSSSTASTASSPFPTSASVQGKPENAPIAETKAVGDVNSFISSLLASSSGATSPVLFPTSTSAPNPTASTPVMDREAKLKLLSMSKCSYVIDIPPSEVVTYEKGCQTEEEDKLFLLNSDREERDLPTRDLSSDKRSSRRLASNPLKQTASWHTDSFPAAANALSANIAANLSNLNTKETLRAKALSEEERSVILSGKPFKSFLASTSLYVERALEQNQRQDILRNYALDARDGETRGASSLLDLAPSFEDETVRGRPIMDVTFSALHGDLFAVAYGTKPIAATAVAHRGGLTLAPGLSSSLPASASSSTSTAAATAQEDNCPGMVCVWSFGLHKRPEFRFSAMSAVLATLFHASEPHLVLGGCYNGQIVMWDMRANRTLPVLRSSVTGKGHKHPVFAMSMLSASTTPTILPNNELLSLSMDGLLCHWDVNQLSEPVVTVNMLSQAPPKPVSQGMNLLASPQPEAASSSNTSALNTCSMAIHIGENHTLQMVVGSGSGHLLSSQLPVKSGTALRHADGHYGLVTCLSAHPNASSKYRHLLLSCSVDWSIRLWHVQHFSKPLLEFAPTSCDYIASVQWCPTHPAVFAAITSGGRLTLWNIARSCTEPQDSLSVLHREGGEDGPMGVAAPSGLSSAGLASKSTSNVFSLTGSGKTASATHALHKTHTMASMVLPTSASAAASAAAIAPVHPGAAAGTPGSVALCKLTWTADGQSIVVGDSTGNVHSVRIHGNATVFTSQEESKLEAVLLSAMENLTKKA